MGELYSLVQFLQLDPYCYYFCRGDNGTCDCKCLELQYDDEGRFCELCGHGGPQHYSLFNRDVVNPIRKFGYVGAGRNAFVCLKRDVLDLCLLRRTKARRRPPLHPTACSSALPLACLAFIPRPCPPHPPPLARPGGPRRRDGAPAQADHPRGQLP